VPVDAEAWESARVRECEIERDKEIYSGTDI